MSQYFENDPRLDHNIKMLELRINDINLTLNSDRGVFSNTGIDEGSKILLKALPELKGVLNVLDVGCGYGTLGLYIAKLNPLVHVTLFDINERAVDLTKQNIKENNLTNANALVSSNYQAFTKQNYDLIVINPPIRAGKKVYYPLLSDARDYLTDGGKLLFVIRKSHGALSAVKYLGAYYRDIVLVKRDKGFHVYYATK